MNNVLHDAVEQNLRAAMRCYARVSARGEARDYPGITVTSCGLDCAVFNSAMLSTAACEKRFPSLIELASLHFRRRRLGWTFWLCEELLDEVGRIRARGVFRDLRMECIASPPGMYAERLAAPDRPPAQIQIRPVIDETTRSDFAHLSSVIFNLGCRTSRDIYGGADLWNGCMRGWVGYAEGRPVSLVALVIAAGVAGVYSVGTLPEMQRQGFAETLVRHALSEARETTGLEATVLQSTRQGQPLYERLGYRIVTRFSVYLQEGNGLS